MGKALGRVCKIKRNRGDDGLNPIIFISVVSNNRYHEVFDSNGDMIGSVFWSDGWVFAPRSYCNAITLEEMKEIVTVMEELE